MLWLTLVCAIIYSCLIGIATGLWVYNRHHGMLQKGDQGMHAKLSVLVPFRNEATYLAHLVDCLSQQTLDRDQWECIFIDDHSTDESLDLVKGPFNFQSIAISSRGEGKKAALTTGLSHASNEYIVQTDADSLPGSNWLSSILQLKGDQSEVMITGPVSIKKTETLLDYFQAFDLMAFMGMTYAGIKTGWWHMGNGANLAYPKSLKLKESDPDQMNQTGHHYASGDDMFLIESAIRSHQYTLLFNFNPDATVYTAACPNLHNFIQQRLRWGTKNTAMRSPGLKTTLAISLGFNILLVFILMASCLNHAWILPAILLWLQKLIIDFVFLYFIAPFFNYHIKVWPYLICGIAYPVYTLYMVCLGIFNRKYEWKGRIVK